MATSKKTRPRAVSKRPKKKTASKATGPAKKAASPKKAAPGRKVASAKKAASARKAASAVKAPRSSALKSRNAPETLRLKSFTPSLTVNDLGKSLAFYTDALGFIVGEKWTDGDVLRGVMLKAGATELGLSQDDWKLGRDRKKGEGFRIWCDTAQDLDVIAARVRAAGFSLTDEPADHAAWGVRTFSVDDPDGFHLTIARDL